LTLASSVQKYSLQAKGLTEYISHFPSALRKMQSPLFFRGKTAALGTHPFQSTGSRFASEGVKGTQNILQQFL